jgi:mannose-6-phosphate isomerase-like protein (cupin superfamily)
MRRCSTVPVARRLQAAVAFALAIAGLLPPPAARAQETLRAEAIEEILTAFGEAYHAALPESLELAVQFHFSEPDTAFHLDIEPGRAMTVRQGRHDAPAVSFALSGSTLARLHAGTLTAFTAAAKPSPNQPALMELTVHAAADALADPTNVILEFLQHYFTVERPERIRLERARSLLIHGVHAIPLYYGVGFRSAWYQVTPGQQLNEPGAGKPFPQAYIIIGGHGRARIGAAETDVRAGESYYVPPGADHIFWPAEDTALEVIWIAWGPGA